jgi:cyclase
VSIPVIASGGAGKAEDFATAVRDGHASAVLAASVFHFGQMTIDEAKSAMADVGVPVRRLSATSP